MHSDFAVPRRLYSIIDTSYFPEAQACMKAAAEMADAGVAIVQYRNKTGNARQMLDEAQQLRRLLPDSVRLIMNDRADLCIAAGCDGVHVGQDDLSPESARKVVGAERWVGVSTHNPEQVREAERTSADYIAIGPVFGTSSKANPDPVIGLEGVRTARTLTGKPLVAIGGITRSNCRSVIEAGADAVAVISDLCRDSAKSAQEFLAILR